MGPAPLPGSASAIPANGSQVHEFAPPGPPPRRGIRTRQGNRFDPHHRPWNVAEAGRGEGHEHGSGAAAGKQQRTGSTQTTTDITAPASRPRRTVGGKVAAAAAGTIATRAKAAGAATGKAASAKAVTAKAATVKVASAKAATAKAATVRAVIGARSAAAAKAATRSAGARSVTAASASARPAPSAKPAVSKASKTTARPGDDCSGRCGACGDEACRCHGDGSRSRPLCSRPL